MTIMSHITTIYVKNSDVY